MASGSSMSCIARPTARRRPVVQLGVPEAITGCGFPPRYGRDHATVCRDAGWPLGGLDPRRPPGFRSHADRELPLKFMTRLRLDIPSGYGSRGSQKPEVRMPRSGNGLQREQNSRFSGHSGLIFLFLLSAIALGLDTIVHPRRHMNAYWRSGGEMLRELRETQQRPIDGAWVPPVRATRTAGLPLLAGLRVGSDE